MSLSPGSMDHPCNRTIGAPTTTSDRPPRLLRAARLDTASPGRFTSVAIARLSVSDGVQPSSSGTPLREWTPLSVKSNPEPVVRSFTVRLARHLRLRPCRQSVRRCGRRCRQCHHLRSSTSPVWSPARMGSPIPSASPPNSEANRAARAGPSKVASTPSPVVLTTRPEYFSAIRCAIRS